MAICRTGEIPIYFEEAGRGRPLILVHGHGVDLRAWDDVVPPLVQAGFRTIRYDARGHGRSGVPERGYGWDAHVRDLEALVANLGVQEVILAGHSMGGGIAMAFALAHPERVAGLVLIASALPGFTHSEEFAAMILDLQAKIRAAGVHPTFEQGFAKLPFFDALRGHPDALDRTHEMMAAYAGREYLIDEDGEDTEPVDFTQTLAAIKAPALVIGARRDLPDFTLIPSLIAEQIPGAELRWFDAGHMLPLEQPGELAEAIIDFATRSIAAAPTRQART